MKIIRINFDQFNSLKEFHLWLKEQCNFPEYYGCNLDALYDCLTDDPHFEFEVVDSRCFEYYQTKLINTIMDTGCRVKRVFDHEL